MNYEKIKQNFEQDVKNHTIEVLLDNGIYRHLRFTNNGSSIYRFDIITFPGFLVYTGDMGSYTFQRLPDMFNFFRKENRDHIDFRYWAEKVVAKDRINGLSNFDTEVFKENVLHHVKQKLDLEDSENIPEDILDELYDVLQAEGEYEAVFSIWNFQNSDKINFDGFWEHNCKEYSYNFIWCCYALQWGIEQYDRCLCQ